MQYRLLGRSGLRVSALALGAMTIGDDWGWGASKDESRKMFDHYAEAGGNFIDTANAYTNGTSETLIGEFIAKDRDHFVVATKYTISERRGDPNFGGNHRKNMRRSVEASLKRLDTDHIDLFWLHMWDFTTPLEEIMRGFDDLVRAGKVLYLGISDTPAWQVSRANMLADLMGWTAFSAVQLRYGLLDRTAERDLLPMARTLDLAITPWSILGRGVLSGKFNKAKPNESTRLDADSPEMTPRNLQIAEAAKNLAAKLGRTPSQIAVNWVRQQPGVVIPLIGARTAAQLDDNLQALDFELSPSDIEALSEVSKIPLGFPHDVIESGMVRNVIHGGTYAKLSNHRRL